MGPRHTESPWPFPPFAEKLAGDEADGFHFKILDPILVRRAGRDAEAEFVVDVKRAVDRFSDSVELAECRIESEGDVFVAKVMLVWPVNAVNWVHRQVPSPD